MVELNTVTRKCEVQKVGRNQFKIVLTQGLNRQIRRMCEYWGYRVEKLTRVRIMNLTLGDLPVGQYRNVTKEELKELDRLLRIPGQSRYPKAEGGRQKR